MKRKVLVVVMTVVIAAICLMAITLSVGAERGDKSPCSGKKVTAAAHEVTTAKKVVPPKTAPNSPVFSYTLKAEGHKFGVRRASKEKFFLRVDNSVFQSKLGDDGRYAVNLSLKDVNIALIDSGEKLCIESASGELSIDVLSLDNHRVFHGERKKIRDVDVWIQKFDEKLDDSGDSSAFGWTAVGRITTKTHIYEISQIAIKKNISMLRSAIKTFQEVK